ncbi:hypothetical protein ACW4TU_28615 [Streptomyces sp. QTS52]
MAKDLGIPKEALRQWVPPARGGCRVRDDRPMRS